MHLTRLACGIVALSIAQTASAAQFGIQSITDPSIPIGYNAHEITWDGGGLLDWTSAALRIDLITGDFYQDPEGSNYAPTPANLYLNPTLEFDTHVGIIGNYTNAIAGGAGDLDGGPLSLDAPQLSVSWYNSDKLNLHEERLGVVTLSNNASGTGTLLMDTVELPFTITNGVIPDLSAQIVIPPPPPPTLDLPDNPPLGLSFHAVNHPDVPNGYVAQQIIWNGGGTNGFYSSALLAFLTSGSTYQHPHGGDSAPEAAALRDDPGLLFDTYLGIIDDDTTVIDSITNLDGPNVNASWRNDNYNDYGIVQVGMITFSEDAQGQFVYLSGGFIETSVINGRIIPEPTCLTLCIFTGAALLQRRTSSLMN